MKGEAVRHPGINLGDDHGEAHSAAETLVFGFWVFLMSDLIVFGLMFCNLRDHAHSKLICRWT